MSPYELEVRQGGVFRTALLAAVQPGQLSSLEAVLADPPASLAEDLASVGLTNVSVFAKPLAGGEWCVVYAEYRGVEREDAAAALEKSSLWWLQVQTYLEPHPLAAKRGALWLRMEWMNHVGGAEQRPAQQVQRLMVVTRLRPEQELWYRTLHQTNWPGVADQMSRSRVRHWTSFLTGIADELYLFSYHEYIGDDFAADMAAMGEDPVTQRWWTHTEPCLNPLPEMHGRGSWAPLRPLLLVPAA